MKILHCILSMTGGGAERQLTYLAAESVARGHEVHVALVYPGPNLQRLERAGCAIHRLRARVRRDPSVGLKLLRLARAVRPDVIQTWLTHMDILGGGVARLLQIPWVVSERSSEAGYPPGLLNMLRARLARGADAIVANSAAGESYWAGRVRPGTRLAVIPNGLPLAEIDGASPTASDVSGEREEIILFVGRFNPEKNLDNLMEGLRLLLARRSAKAILCGDGPLRPEYEARVAEWRLGDRITFSGHVAEVWSIMKRSSVLVSVGLFEGHPNVAIEAMACGLPVVLSDIPAHRELLAETEALFVDPRSPEEMARSIETALADRNAALRRAARARERVERWSIPALAAAHDNVYREILRAREGPGIGAAAARNRR